MYTILQGVVGSRAYGLAREDSDIDTKGVYVASLDEVLGLNGPEVVSNSISLTGPDLEMHEVGKYCRLALKCNPTVLEQMWLKSYLHLDEAGQILIDNRQYFLSEPAIRGSYGEYARSQAERLMRRQEEGKDGFSSDTKNRTAKHGRHCMRLLIQGKELLKYGEINVDVSKHRDLIFEMGELAANKPESFYRIYSACKADFDETSSLLEQFPHRGRINTVLTDIRWLIHERD